MSDITLLQNVSLFSRLDTKHLKAILKACTERIFEPGEFLVEQGHPGIGLFIIMEGKVSIVKTLRDGEAVHIADNGPGEVIGEMSVLDGALRTASVKAIERTNCLVLSAWSFKSLMENHPEVALGVLPIIMQRFRETNNALLDISSRNHDARA
jgi:CRP-like cAMP-binding protein